MDALQESSIALGEDLLDVLDSLFILLERTHSKFILSSICSLLGTLANDTVFSFLSNVPCDISSIEWIEQCLLSENCQSSVSLIFMMVFYCKWADNLKQVKPFPILGINVLNYKQINQSLKSILKYMTELIVNQDIPYLDAFLVYLFHSEQPHPEHYQFLVQHLLSTQHKLIYRFIEILLKERKSWQFQSMRTFISVVKEISPQYMFPLIQLCPLEECIDSFLAHWLQTSGLFAVTYCMHEWLSRHLRERLFIALLDWSQSVTDEFVVKEEEEELVDSVISNPEMVLQALRTRIPPTRISKSHFSYLLHTIIRHVESNVSYLPLIFLTAHDPQFHSSSLIESCHNLVSNCLNQQFGVEYRFTHTDEVKMENERTSESLFSLFKNVSISAVFLLLLGAKDLSTISTLFIAMMVEAGIKERESIQEIKDILLFSPVLTDILHHSDDPLIILYLFEYIDSKKLDPLIYSNVLISILSKPLLSIPFNELYARNQEVLLLIKESYNLSWNVGTLCVLNILLETTLYNSAPD